MGQGGGRTETRRRARGGFVEWFGGARHEPRPHRKTKYCVRWGYWCCRCKYWRAV